jgi:protein-S-isoprenylcysteine O-methyltransferase Ste14
MKDLPGLLLAATIWAYWICVGAMAVRVRRRTHKMSGIVPTQRVEQMMWLAWVPLVVAWMTLPYLAVNHSNPPWGLPEFARQAPYEALRWAAAAIGVACLALSIECWLRMGKNWRMAVTPDQSTELVTSGLYGYIRHPIYALSIALMVCTVFVAPTVPVLAMAAVHVALMLAKAGNEERFLAERHGQAYRDYCSRTGRFLPRMQIDSRQAGSSR